MKRKLITSLAITAVVFGMLSSTTTAMAQNDTNAHTQEMNESENVANYDEVAENTEGTSNQEMDSLESQSESEQNSDSYDSSDVSVSDTENVDEEANPDSESEEAVADAIDEQKQIDKQKKEKPWYYISLADILSQLIFIGIITLIGYYMFLRARK